MRAGFQGYPQRDSLSEVGAHRLRRRPHSTLRDDLAVAIELAEVTEAVADVQPNGLKCARQS